MRIFKRSNPFRKDLLAAVVLILVAILFERFDVFETLELKTVDLRFKIRGEESPHPSLIMVDITDIPNDEIEEFRQWPFPRHVHGWFVDVASELGVKQVIYDIYFSKERDTESDAFLGQMAQEANNCFFPIKFHPYQVSDEGQLRDVEQSVLPFSFADAPVDSTIFTAHALLDVPLSAVSHNSKYMGFINTVHDSDGVSRRTPAVANYKERLYMQVGLAAFVDYCQIPHKNVTFTSGKSIVIPNATVGDSTRDIVIPLDKKNNILINWCGDWPSLKHYSFRDIIVSYKQIQEGLKPIISKKELESFKDKIMIVGYVGRNSHDYYPTPFSEHYFLSGLQYNLYHTLLTEDFLTETPKTQTILYVVLLIALFTFLFWILPPWSRPLLIISFAGGFFAIAQFLFSFEGVILPVVRPISILTAHFGVLSFNHYIREHQIHKQVKLTFKKYVSKDVMEQLLSQPEMLKPGGELKDLTILFSDIRGFTAMSEKHTPEEVVKVLNEYLASMTKVIFQFHGTIDKFVGDEIMVYFGAPLYPENHHGRAIQAALAMQATLKELQKKWKEESRPILKIGIGINSGEVVIGNVGSDQYMDFTLIGDNVNISARLCSKALPGEIIISDSTYEAIKDHIEVAMAREITVKGKEFPIKTYSIGNYRHDLEEEKRAFMRHVFVPPISTTIVVGNVSFKAEIIDFSAGGCHIRTIVKAEQGSPVQFPLFISDTMQRNHCTGRVVTCRQLAEGDFRWRVNFTGQTEEEQHELTRWVIALNETTI